MSNFVVKTACGAEKDFDSLPDAEEGKDTHHVLCEDCSEEDIEILAPGEGENTAPDSAELLAEETGRPKEEFSEPEDAEYPDPTDENVVNGTQEMPVSDEYTLPEQDKNLTENPVDWMPSHFVDDIQGVPTVNRMGYCVIAERYGVSVTAEPVTLASDTDFEYAEFQAIAVTQDGQEYSGFGSAHVDRQDGDDEHLLNELAETRALKRAVSWATGMGITAVEEMQGEL